MKKPNIFISHRWAYNNDYYNLITKFDNLGWRYSNYSVPEHNPLDFIKVIEIESQLEEQVRQCNFFIVFANMAMNNSEWVDKEIQYALKYNKYILGVKPWGYTGNIPKYIQICADDIVGFNTPSIIRKIEWWLSD